MSSARFHKTIRQSQHNKASSLDNSNCKPCDVSLYNSRPLFPNGGASCVKLWLLLDLLSRESHVHEGGDLVVCYDGLGDSGLGCRIWPAGVRKIGLIMAQGFIRGSFAPSSRSMSKSLGVLWGVHLRLTANTTATIRHKGWRQASSFDTNPLLLLVSKDILYKDCTGIVFPYSLLRTST